MRISPRSFPMTEGRGSSHNHRHCGDFPRLDPKTSFPFPTFEANTRDISSFPHFLLSDFHEFLSNEISKEISNCLLAFLMRVFLNLSFSSGQITFLLPTKKSERSMGRFGMAIGFVFEFTFAYSSFVYRPLWIARQKFLCAVSFVAIFIFSVGYSQSDGLTYSHRENRCLPHSQTYIHQETANRRHSG